MERDFCRSHWDKEVSHDTGRADVIYVKMPLCARLTADDAAATIYGTSAIAERCLWCRSRASKRSERVDLRDTQGITCVYSMRLNIMNTYESGCAPQHSVWCFVAAAVGQSGGRATMNCANYGISCWLFRPATSASHHRESEPSRTVHRRRTSPCCQPGGRLAPHAHPLHTVHCTPSHGGAQI